MYLRLESRVPLLVFGQIAQSVDASILSQNENEIPITGAVLPNDIRGVHLTIDIGGRRLEQKWCVVALAGANTCKDLPDVTPNITYPFVWDGLDAFGRPLVGRPVARITVTYIYTLKYYPAAAEFESSFGQLPSETTFWNGRASCGNQLVGSWNQYTGDASGLPTGIVAPGGQRTGLALNGEGFLSQISNPIGQSHRMNYAAGGLISEFIQPGGETSRYSYGAEGRLTKVQRPNGEEKSLTRIQSRSALTVTVTTKGGLVTTYLMDSLSTGENRRQVIQPDGTSFTLLVQPDRTRVQVLADGTRITETVAADPRWGMTAPYINQEIVTTPGGLVRETTTTKSVTELSRLNPMSFASLRTDTSERNGGWSGPTSSVTYDSATRTYTYESAENKETTVVVDEKGQIVRLQMGNEGTIEPILYTYDSRGWLAKVAQGNLSLTNNYNEQNWLVSQTDAAGRTLLFENDAAGRVIRAQFPGGQSYRYAYDANGRQTSVTMPNGTVHNFGYNPVGDEATRSISGQPGGLTRTFNSDGVLSGESLPSGGQRTFGFDQFGRLTTSLTAYDSGAMLYDNQTG